MMISFDSVHEHVFLIAKIFKMKRLSLSKNKRASTASSTKGDPVNEARKKELYHFRVNRPPGFTNPSSNCYANSMLQCLFNSGMFREIIEKIPDGHKIQGNFSVI